MITLFVQGILCILLCHSKLYTIRPSPVEHSRRFGANTLWISHDTLAVQGFFCFSFLTIFDMCFLDIISENKSVVKIFKHSGQNWFHSSTVYPQKECAGFGSSMSLALTLNNYSRCIAIGASPLLTKSLRNLSDNNTLCKTTANTNGSAYIYCQNESHRMNLFFSLIHFFIAFV